MSYSVRAYIIQVFTRLAGLWRIAQFQDGSQFFFIIYGNLHFILGEIIEIYFWRYHLYISKNFLHIFNEKLKYQTIWNIQCIVFSQRDLKVRICTTSAQFYK